MLMDYTILSSYNLFDAKVQNKVTRVCLNCFEHHGNRFSVMRVIHFRRQASLLNEIFLL